MRRFILSAAVLAFIIGGCDNNVDNMDIRHKYPEWPKWGWWEHPAASETADEDQSKTQDDETLAGRPETPEDRDKTESQESQAADEKNLTPLPDVRMTKEQLARRIELLEAHRERIWRSVSMLREIDSLPLAEQNELRRKILENLDKWYEPMPMSPPNTKQQDWTDIVIWDFMPTPQFNQAINRWRTIAEKKNLQFPENPTRRELLQYINDYVSGNLKPNTPDK